MAVSYVLPRDLGCAETIRFAVAAPVPLTGHHEPVTRVNLAYLRETDPQKWPPVRGEFWRSSRPREAARPSALRPTGAVR